MRQRSHHQSAELASMYFTLLVCMHADELPGLAELGLMEWTENGKEKSLRLIKMIANKWKDLGTDGFGMEGSELDNLEGSKLQESCRNVLQKFLQSGSVRTGRPSWQSLIKALNRAELTVAAEKLQHALPLWYEESQR